MDALTPREAEVAHLIVRGLARKRIAAQLGISIHTVDEHVQNAAAKLPGDGSPKLKLVLFVIELRRPKQEAG